MVLGCRVVAYVRTVRTASGARAVQIVHSRRRRSRDIEHIGSAHTDVDLKLLKAVARQRLAAGQGELELRMPGSPANGGAALPITSSRMGHLLDALARGYDVLGFAAATGRDEVFRPLRRPLPGGRQIVAGQLGGVRPVPGLPTAGPPGDLHDG